MIRRDYFRRVIEQLAAALRPLFGLRQAARFEEARLLLSQGCRRVLGLDMRLIAALDAAELRRLLAPAGEPEPARWAGAATLLAEYADVLESEGKPDEAAAARLNALDLARAAASALPSPDPDLETLLKRLGA